MLRHHARRHRAGVDAAEFAAFAVGDKVLTPEGVTGTVTEVLDGPEPATEAYTVTLDGGLGGGTYGGGELRAVQDTTAKLGARTDAPERRDDEFDVEAAKQAGELHTAAEDYPELGDILLSRPPLEHVRRAAKLASNWSGQPMNLPQPEQTIVNDIIVDDDMYYPIMDAAMKGSLDGASLKRIFVDGYNKSRPYASDADVFDPADWDHLARWFNTEYSGMSQQERAQLDLQRRDTMVQDGMWKGRSGPPMINGASKTASGPRPFSKTADDRTGNPEIDRVIEEFLKQPLGDWTTSGNVADMRDPSLAHGLCQEVTEQFVAFAKAHGLRAYVTNTDLGELGYKTRGKPQGLVLDDNGNMVEGFYGEHTVASVYVSGQVWPYIIDFAASQYGYKDLPKVTSSRKAATSSDPFFHGTPAELHPGDIITPASERGSGWHAGGGYDYYDPNFVYLTDDTYGAEKYAVRIAGQQGLEPHIYEVEPLDEVVPDPEQQSGFATNQWATKRARVVREVPLPGYVHWEGGYDGFVKRGPKTASTMNRYPGTCVNCGNDVDADRGFVRKNRETGKWETTCFDCRSKLGRTHPLVTIDEGGRAHTRYAPSVTPGYDDAEVHRCNDCDQTVAWVRSPRSGKNYLANVYPSRSESGGGYRVYPFDAHTHDKTSGYLAPKCAMRIDELPPDGTKARVTYKDVPAQGSYQRATNIASVTVTGRVTRHGNALAVDDDDGKMLKLIAIGLITSIEPVHEGARKVAAYEGGHGVDRNAPGVFWHGTPSGDLRGGAYGLHVGTYEAAKQALEARIGRPAEGEWDGTRRYGDTPLVSTGTGYGVGTPTGTHLPSGGAVYSDGTKVSLDSKPDIIPVRIKGEMTNTPHTPHEDFKANGLMHAQISRGRARRGYYYTNIGEDDGSISAVVPSGNHLERLAARHTWWGSPQVHDNASAYDLVTNGGAILRVSAVGSGLMMSPFNIVKSDRLPWGADIRQAVENITDDAQREWQDRYSRFDQTNPTFLLIGSGGKSAIIGVADRLGDAWSAPRPFPDVSFMGLAPKTWQNLGYGSDQDLWDNFAREVADVRPEDEPSHPGVDEEAQTITIYRGISLAPGVNPPDAVKEDTGGVGGSWTSDLDVAKAIAERGGAGFTFNNRPGGEVTISARNQYVPTVLRCDVDIQGGPASLYESPNYHYLSEQEVDVPRGTQITVTGWMQAEEIPVDPDERASAIDAQQRGDYSRSRSYTVTFRWDLSWTTGNWARTSTRIPILDARHAFTQTRTLWRGLLYGAVNNDELNQIRANPSAWARNFLATEELGIHWTDDPTSAENFALDRDPEGWAHENDEFGDEGEVATLGLMLQAEVNEADIIDPDSQEGEGYAFSDSILDYGVEREVTVRANSAIRLTDAEILWSGDGDGSLKVPISMQVRAGVLDTIRNTDPYNVPSTDWCRFRRNSHCWYPKQLDANATKQAGYAVWLPEDRGWCPRPAWDAQKKCPVSEPGPLSGDPNARVDATIPWEQGGQRGGVPQGVEDASPWKAASYTPPKIARKVVASLPEGWKFSTGYGDAVPGGYNGTIHALDPDGVVRGYIDYQTARDDPQGTIAMIEVDPDYRRQGIASALYEHLRTSPDHAPGLTWSPGVTTPEGDAWWRAQKHAKLAEYDYRGQHQPNADGPPLHNLLEGDQVPDDIYDHPEYYLTPSEPYSRESIAAVKAARGKPDAMVTVYRGAPPGVRTLGRGDWVSLSPTYARQIGFDPTDPSKDWPVYSAQVRASDVHWAMDDLNEWGYWGPDIPMHDAHVAKVAKPITLDGEKLFEMLGYYALPPWRDEHGNELGGGIDCAPLAQELIGAVNAITLPPSLGWHLTATWNDVRSKAKRLRSEGRVKIVSTPNRANPYIVATVEGDHGIYETRLMRTPGRKTVAAWECACPWSSYSWGRSGRWKKYEGRMCSHAYALQLEAASQEMFGGEMREYADPIDWSQVQRGDRDRAWPSYYDAPRAAAKEMRCQDCKSNDLFSGWFDEDDLAVSNNIDAPVEGARWKTFCNNCGAEVKLRTQSSYDVPKAASKIAAGDITAERDVPEPGWTRISLPGRPGYTTVKVVPNEYADQLRTDPEEAAKFLKRMTSIKDYNHKGLAGLVEQRKARSTGTTVGVYHTGQAGFDDPDDPDVRWSTVCEDHGGIVMHRSLADARAWASRPEEWCPTCMGEDDPNEHDTSLDIPPASLIARGMLEDGQTPTQVLAWARALYAPHAEQVLTAALGGDILVKVRDTIRKVVDVLDGEHIELDDGTVVSAQDALNPKYDPRLGLDPRDATKHAVSGADANGVMVAVVPPRDVLDRLAALPETTEPEDQLHITLLYLGDTDEVDEDAFLQAVERFAHEREILAAKIAGVGAFENPDSCVLWASIDSPGLAELRSDLLRTLQDAGFDSIRLNHGFTPHMTLAYQDEPFTELPELPADIQEPFAFTTLVAAYGGDWRHFPLQTAIERAAFYVPHAAARKVASTTVWRGITLQLDAEQGQRVLDLVPHAPAEASRYLMGLLLAHPETIVEGNSIGVWWTQSRDVALGYVGEHFAQDDYYGPDHVGEGTIGVLLKGSVNASDRDDSFVGYSEEQPMTLRPGAEIDIIGMWVKFGSQLVELPVSVRSVTAKVAAGGWHALADSVLNASGGGNLDFRRETLYANIEQTPDLVAKAMELWRSSFINSSNMRAVMEGNVPASGWNDDFHVFMAKVLDRALDDAGPLGQTTWRSMMGGYPVGTSVELVAAAVASERTEADRYADNLPGGVAQVLLQLPASARGLWYPDHREAIVRDSFRVVDNDAGVTKLGASLQEGAEDVANEVTEDAAKHQTTPPTGGAAEAEGAAKVLKSVLPEVSEAFASLHTAAYTPPQGATATLHDEPEPALPSTDGADDDEDCWYGDDVHEAALAPAKRSWLMAGEASAAVENAEIAAKAAETLAKLAGKTFTPAEQAQLINEGEDVTAANLDRLDITGTHYMQLEEALRADEDDESWLLI